MKHQAVGGLMQTAVKHQAVGGLMQTAAIIDILYYIYRISVL